MRDRAFKQFIRPNVYDWRSDYDALAARLEAMMLCSRRKAWSDVTMLAHVAASAMKDNLSIIVCCMNYDVILSSFGNGVNDRADDEQYVLFDRR